MIDGDEAQMARPVFRSLLRGAACRCPKCGNGRLYGGYLQTADQCSACDLELHHHRADDAPPYFTMVIVGHVVIGLVLFAEMSYSPPVWVHMALWLPLALIMSLALMRPIKGVIIGLQWALQMHGFSPEPETTDDPTGRHSL